jgi:aminoglycoside 2'-N-acetyltransferase I
MNDRSLIVEQHATGALTAAQLRAVRALCDEAYGENLAAYFDDVGPGEHLLGWRDGVLAAHIMWVTRWLEPAGQPALRTAYVELVATAPAVRQRGFATALLERFPSLVTDFQLAALGPATERLYTRLGWRYWRGPLFARRDDRLIATPEERIMILPLPGTPRLDLDAPLSVEWRPGEVW